MVRMKRLMYRVGLQDVWSRKMFFVVPSVCASRLHLLESSCLPPLVCRAANHVREKEKASGKTRRRVDGNLGGNIRHSPCVRYVAPE